jgi:serine/threonine-protein kinase
MSPGDGGQPNPVPVPTVADAATVPQVPAAGKTGLSPGTILNDRYRIESTLGRGGMGEVYLAHDLTLDRQVAVKMIRPNSGRLRGVTISRAMYGAFIREARTGASLTHPAIATVFDFGFRGDDPFIVFEYIDGETLGETLRRRGRLPLEDVRLILAPQAQALQFAHSRQVVHRDLKPENIRSTRLGQYKILDLGLARDFREAGEWRFAGTPRYTSPEQAAGQACDGRADQYALAVIAFRLLTGRHLFEAEGSAELLRLHREQDPPSVRGLVPDIPESVDKAIQRALHKNPNERFDSCQDFAAAMGCQFLTSPAAGTEVLRLTPIHTMSGRWLTGNHFRLTRKGTNLCLIATAESLWVWDRASIRRWRLASIDSVRQRLSTLRLTFRTPNGLSRQSFSFWNRSECAEWCRLISSAKEALAASASRAEDSERVVLLRHAPPGRYQFLGPVDYQDENRSRAEIGLNVRATALGADAVIDLQEERIPGFSRTIWRLSGSAIRSVDSDGRQELRVRWFAAEVGRLSYWMLVLLALEAAVNLSCLSLRAGSLLTHYYGVGESGFLVELMIRVFVNDLFILGVPISLVVLLRRSKWPQLVRPTTLAFLILQLQTLFVTVLRLVLAVASGSAGRLVRAVLGLADPVLFIISVFATVLSLKTLRAYGSFRKVVPGEAPVPTDARRRTCKVVRIASGLYIFVLLLMTFNLFSCGMLVPHFSWWNDFLRSLFH